MTYPDLQLTALIKITDADGRSMHGGRGTWTLGRWRSVKPPLEPCKRGLHVVTIAQALMWLGPRIGIVEVAGERIDEADKTVVQRARVTEWLDTWDEHSARLFAADCAEHVLHLFEAARPGDDRPRRAIETARAFARGEATREDEAAAGDAARDAAWAAAGDAAWAAGDAARATGAAARAARAAWAAAGDAARDAAWAAAWAAARDVAGAAARATGAAAGDAARDAARDVAGAAARAAAGGKERARQAERLLAYLRGEA